MKVCLVGDVGVGKTNIALRFAKGTFQHYHEYTISASFMSRSVNIDGEMIEYRIWDTAGQEKVPYEDGKSYADRNNAIFMETSAKTRKNIEEVFYKIGRALKSELSEERRSTVQLVDTQKSHKRRRPCCKS